MNFQLIRQSKNLLSFVQLVRFQQNLFLVSPFYKVLWCSGQTCLIYIQKILDSNSSRTTVINSLYLKGIQSFIGWVPLFFYNNNNNMSWIEVYESKRDLLGNWTTKDGQSIPIKDLTDNHLNNIIDYLKRNNRSKEIIDILEVEQKYRKFLKETNIKFNQYINEKKKEVKFLTYYK